MSFGFDKSCDMFASTPVDNLFLVEFMGGADGDYVKVYLAGLKQCFYPDEDYSIKKMAADLNLDENTVKNAFIYWAQLNLVEIESRRPFKVKYKNLMMAMQNGDFKSGPLYSHKELVLELQRIFGGSRLLGPADVTLMMEWVDELGFSPEAVTLVASWCSKYKSEGGTKKVSFKYIDAVMRDLYDHDLMAYDQIEAHLKNMGASVSGAKDVLDAWNLRRLPTEAEMELYDKWTAELGFSQHMIIKAAHSMTGVQSPNFKYLDSTLTGWHEAQIDTPAKADAYIRHFSSIKRTLAALASDEPVDHYMIQRYTAWLDMGFSPAGIVKAARGLSLKDVHSVRSLDSLLQKWKAGNTVSDAAIDEYLKEAGVITARRQDSKRDANAGIYHRDYTAQDYDGMISSPEED